MLRFHLLHPPAASSTHTCLDTLDPGSLLCSQLYRHLTLLTILSMPWMHVWVV
jgi:hypothetical protein